MAFQDERVPGGLDMCSNVGSMARDGSFCSPTTGYNQWGSSPLYTEHELCRQTNSESHNSGAIASQRSTEQAAIISATNGTTRGECFQPPLQTTWSWQARQADIGGLRTQLEEEWKTRLEEEKRKHNLEVKQLKEEVGRGNRDRKSLQEKSKQDGELELLKREVRAG